MNEENQERKDIAMIICGLILLMAALTLAVTTGYQSHKTDDCKQERL